MIEALVNADLVVVGPGSLYTSILPNLLVDGVAATVSAVKAPRVYVANLMTEPGETDGYSLADHLRAIREHTGFRSVRLRAREPGATSRIGGGTVCR